MKDLWETITEINDQKEYRIGKLEFDNKVILSIKDLATGKHSFIKMTAKNINESMEQLKAVL